MRISLLVLAAFVAVGCDGPGTDPDVTADTGEDSGDIDDTGSNNSGGLPPEEFITCASAPPPAPGSLVDWEHTATDLMMALHPDPDHSAQDMLVTDAAAAHIEGKFAYGVVSKDLEDEWVEAWIDDCSGAYVYVGEGQTDSDGRIRLEVPDALLPGFGRFATLLRVKGDQTTASSELRRYPVGTELMVSDIDGTLTTADMELFQDLTSELFEPLFGGEYVPEARFDALETMQLRDEQGYVLVYLSGRPYYLGDITHEWLDDLGFPEATVHIIDGTAAAAPTNSAVGAFKRDYLSGLADMGFVLNGAYGNATTDIYGYGEAGVQPSRTWIAGIHGGEGGTVAVGDDYATHLTVASAEASPDQPFVNVP